MAQPNFEKLRDLDLSHTEIEQLGTALKSDEFRELFTQYLDEIQDPENRRIFQEEIIQLERERGIDAQFVNPKPGYVIKTSINGVEKCFINICANDNIQKPTSQRKGTGHNWTLPHVLTQGREDVDKKGLRCRVYDCVFNPLALEMATKNPQFKTMLNNTALDTIQENYHIALDKKNIKMPRMTYKGCAQASIIRKPAPSLADIIQRTGPEKEFFDQLYTEIDKMRQPTQKKHPKRQKKFKSAEKAYTTPKYVIKHRNHIDLQEFTGDKTGKLNCTIPKELQIEINLPMLKSANDVLLNVTERTLEITSERPAKYQLSLTLPYAVNETSGNAKFDKDLKLLIVILPVIQPKIQSITTINTNLSESMITDSGAENDLDTMSRNDLEPLKMVSVDEDHYYELPEYEFLNTGGNLTFKLYVNHVDESTVIRTITSHSVQLKFTSISPSFYTAHYSFYVQIPVNNQFDVNRIKLECFPNNLVLTIELVDDGSNALTSYSIGLNGDDDDVELRTYQIRPQSASIEIEKNPMVEDENSGSDTINVNNIGILKNSVGRSVSESSLDEYYVYGSSSEPSSGSLKKTVRFNDVIKKQVYRSTSSILSRKSKNQRKARNKRERAIRKRSNSNSEEASSEIDEEKLEEICDLMENLGDTGPKGVFQMDMS